MTGVLVAAASLHPGEVIHLEPHLVRGAHVTPRHLDVKVTGVRSGDGCRPATGWDVVAIDWEPCGLGSVPGEVGTTVFERLTPVLVIGGAP